MDFVMTFAIVALAILIVCLVAYIYNTNSIIRTQEKQIARLRTENFRLRAVIKNKSNVRVVEIHDSRIDPENIPNYNDI